MIEKIDGNGTGSFEEVDMKLNEVIDVVNALTAGKEASKPEPKKAVAKKKK